MTGQRRSTDWLAGLAVAGTIAGGWLFIACVPLAGMPPERLMVGLLLGTAFGQATLAAVWSALGPLRLAYRLPLILAGLFGLLIAITIAFTRPPLSPDGVLMLGGSVFAQWTLAQAPLWALVWWLGVRIQHHSLAPAGATDGRIQFGTRQLMIFTAVVAIALGAGRAAVLLIDWTKIQSGVSHEVPIFAFIVLVNTLFTLPLALGTLLRRWSLLAWFIGVALIAGATQIEVSVVSGMLPGSEPELPVLFWALNLCQAGWVMIVLTVLRFAGYRLAIARAAAASQEPAAVAENPFAQT